MLWALFRKPAPLGLRPSHDGATVSLRRLSRIHGLLRVLDQKILQKHGYRVLVAANLAEALRICTDRLAQSD